QGVSFRWTIADYAERLNLCGTVQNLKDGSVELFLTGSQAELNRFLETIEKQPGLAEIRSITTKFQESGKKYPDFQILF
ncbi:MAG: acylphosphatase, partial [Chlamydiales bacterium]